MRNTPKHHWEDAYLVIEPQINADSVHIWPFHPEFPIDVRFLRFAPTSEIRPNRHNYFEILYVCSGAVTYQVQDQSYSVSQGDLFIMGSTLLHGIKRFETPGMKAAVLYFTPDLLGAGDRTSEQMEYLMPFMVQEPGFPHVVPARSEVPGQLYELMVRAHRELPANSNRARLSIKTYLKMMLVLLVNHFASYRGGEAVFERQHRNIEKLQPLFQHIDRHYHEPLTIEDAAALLHMSKSSFMRFFKEVTGQSFVGYLNRFRVAKAEALLASTELPISEIGQRVGFCDQSYFGFVFRNILQITPREYQQRLSATVQRRT